MSNNLMPIKIQVLHEMVLDTRDIKYAVIAKYSSGRNGVCLLCEDMADAHDFIRKHKGWWSIINLETGEEHKFTYSTCI